MTSAGNVASSSSNYATGLTNAFMNAHLLADTTNGLAATLPSNLSIQTGKLYALADALGGCVNSDGTTGCSALFAAATPSGGTAPTNTLTAALNIVKNPGNKVGPVFMAIPTSPAYATTLTQAPNDWTMSLTVTGGGLYGPTQLATDTLGNVWVADYFGAVSAFSPQGTAKSPAAGATATSGGFGNGSLSGIYGLAVDTNDNVFVTNEIASGTSGSVGSVSILNGVTSGNTLGSLVTNTANSTPYFSDTSIQYPESLATDTNGNILIGLDNGAASSYVTIYNSSGSLVRAGLGIPLGSGVFGVSADQAHGAWMANNAGNTVTHADSNGQVISASNCCSEPAGVATDAQGNAWVTNFGSNSISEIQPGCDTNTINRSSTCTGAGGNVITLNQTVTGGLFAPQGVVVDAGQNVWVANFHSTGTGIGAAIVEIAGNSNTLAAGTGISPSTGYGLDAGLVEPFGLALDPSGNIWVSDEGANQVVMFFGVATPTATPVGPTPTAP
jgi:streptogramin lyase